MAKTRVELNVSPVSQPARNACWMACYQMILKFHNKPWAKASIETAFKRAGLDFNVAYRKGLADTEFEKACKALGFVNAKIPFGTGKAKQGAVQILVNYLSMGKKGTPLWVAGTWPGSRHIHVVCGADAERKMLCQIDPWHNGISAAEALWVDFDSYVSAAKNRGYFTQHMPI